MHAHRIPAATVAMLSFLAFSAPLAQDTPAPEALAAAEEGSRLFDAGEFAAALEQLDTALAGGAVDGRTLFRAGFSQRMTGKPTNLVQQTLTRALQALDRSVNQSPETATLVDRAYLALAYQGIGDAGTARQTAIAAVRSYKEGRYGGVGALPAEDAYHLGRLAALAGDGNLQRNAYDRAAQAGSDWPETHPDPLGRAFAGLGRLDLSTGEYEKARARLARALELVPARRLPGVRFDSAAALFRLGRYSEAEIEWDRVRLEDPAREAQAGYARQLMRTLDQLPVLLDQTERLTDLSTFNQADLEMRLLNLAAEMGDVGAALPPEAVRQGYVTRTPDGTARAQRVQMQRYRDLKARTAWVAAEYVARGYALREFAFQNGLQGALRPWGRLPKNRQPTPASENLREDVPGMVPDALIQESEARQREAKERRRENRENDVRPGQRKGKKKTGNSEADDESR